MSEQNKARIRRVIDEVYNKGDLGVVDQVATSELVIHSPSQEIHGREGVKNYVASLRSAFPDLHFEIGHQVAEGDMVVTSWMARGTHAGEFQSLPATGRKIHLAGTDIDRLVHGKVVECWMHMDELGLLRQLGVIEAAPTSSGAGGAAQ